MLPRMDDDHFAGSRYARMRWNTPLSAEHADLLLGQLDLRPVRARLRIADLGCGWGELLLRAVAWSLRLGTAGQAAAGQAGPVRLAGPDRPQRLGRSRSGLSPALPHPPAARALFLDRARRRAPDTAAGQI